MSRITADNLSRIENPTFRKNAAVQIRTAAEYCSALEKTGLRVAQEDETEQIETYKKLLQEQGCIIRNNGHSIVTHSLSPACEACVTGVGSASLYISLKCSRHCYFCFNSNQSLYEQHREEKRDWKRELQYAVQHGIDLRCIALTGGEPLLFPRDVVDFFEYARDKFPHAHLRLYTSGDHLTEALCKEFQKSKLDEIRFSIKLEDTPAERTDVYQSMRLAKQYVPSVLVEMPVEPGHMREMQSLLVDLDGLGVTGINLLELCYPLHNAPAFRRRGYEIKNPPLQTYYNYWYAGGVPIQSSELESLQLVDFSLKHNLRLGVHYCSLANKHSAQLFEQNSAYEDPSRTLIFDKDDFFLKTVKAFGEDVHAVKRQLDSCNCPYIIDNQMEYIQFNPSYVRFISPDIELGLSYQVAERDSSGWILRELRLDYLATNTPAATLRR